MNTGNAGSARVEAIKTEAQLRQLLQREQLLSTVTQRIRGSLNLEEVLQTTVEEVRKLLQTDRVVLFQFLQPDWIGKVVVESISEPRFATLGMSIPDDCFRKDYALKYQDGRIRGIDNIYTADIQPCHRDLLSRFNVQANLVVPVLHNDDLWGLLIAHHCQAPRKWQASEFELLKQLSTVIAIAIQQASLVNQLQAELAERKAISIALQTNQERLQAVVSNAPIALIATDDEGVIELSTGRILHRLVRSQVEAVGCSAFEVYAHLPTFVKDLRWALTGNAFTSSVEYSGYIFEMRYSPTLKANRQIGGVICVATDVTEQRQAEEAVRQSEILRQSEAKNRTLLNAIPDAIYRIRQDGTYLDFKPSKVEMGVASEVALGQRVVDLLPPEVAQQFMVYIQRALGTDKPQVFEYQLQNGKPIDYEARVVGNGPDEVLAIVRDVSERKKVEQLKNEFVSTVSHELRTPLTSIRGSLGLIIGGIAGEIPVEARELIDIAYKNSERLILLINDILDVEKIESGKMNFALRTVELMSLLEQAVAANLAYTTQLNVNISISETLPGVKVNVDSQRFIQVLTNLLSNAAKFSPPGETVTIRVTRQDHMVRVSVQDRGPGIPEEFRADIFQKFAQADSSDSRQKGGTGLGLSIAKAIMERLNGQIGFQTEINNGTTFYCDLPEWLSPDAGDVEQDNTVTLDNSKKPSPARILVCEDDPDIAMLLKIMLQQVGFVIDIAYNAEAAKALLSKGVYHLMTLDLALPGQDGISLIRSLRVEERTRSLPIVVVSAKAQQGLEQLGEAWFAVVDWLDKPIDQERLIAVCKQTIWQNSGSKPKLLHIEDNLDITQVVSLVLKNEVEIHYAVSLQQARQKLEQENFDLIILDISLPDGSGLNLLPFINRQTGLPIPVVLFSAREVSAETASQVTAALVKSRTSNQELLSTIQSLVRQS